MRPLLSVILLGATATLAAQVDKTAHSWNNPTPREQLREMSTDRPDTTESPATVDAGHVQLEMSFVAYARDTRQPDGSDVRAEAWNIAPINVRVGLRHNFEVQVLLDNYLRAEAHSASLGVSERRSGFGDVTVRTKLNLWGNDGGDTALAVMPFLKLPTNSNDLGNDSVEGGIIFPFGFKLGSWGAGAMTEIDFVRNDEDDGYDLVWLNTFTVGFDLAPKLGMFVELASETGQGRHALYFDAGLTYAVNDDLQLDAGVNLGLTRAAVDRTIFVGMSRRF